MNTDIVYLSIIFILVISLILLVIFTQHEKKNHVHESECSKPKGEYAVDPGFQSSDILKTCGSDGRSPCSFKVDNLKNAVNICNRNPEKCYRFMYDNKRRTITFINSTTDLTTNINSDIFTRQD